MLLFKYTNYFSAAEHQFIQLSNIQSLASLLNQSFEIIARKMFSRVFVSNKRSWQSESTLTEH